MKSFLVLFIMVLSVCSAKAQPTEFYELYFEGNSLLVKAQYTKAIENYNKALKLFEADYIYFNRGNAYMGKRDYENALKDFNKTLSMNKDYIEAYCQRGLVKVQLKDKTCCDDLKKAAKLNSPEAVIAIEKVCQKQKK